LVVTYNIFNGQCKLMNKNAAAFSNMRVTTVLLG